jgi:hypothetical protein
VELRQYRHVPAQADHASFRKASKALGISQLALTKRQRESRPSRHRARGNPGGRVVVVDRSIQDVSSRPGILCTYLTLDS